MQKLEFILKVFSFIGRTSEIGRSFIFTFISFSLLLSFGIYSYYFNSDELVQKINNYILNRMDVEMNMNNITNIYIEDKTGDENEVGILLSVPKYIVVRKERDLYSKLYTLHIIILKNSGD